MMSTEDNEISEQIGRVADALRFLGNGDAATDMGAIAAFSVLYKEASMDASCIVADIIAGAIRDAGEAIAMAIRESSRTHHE